MSAANQARLLRLYERCLRTPTVLSPCISVCRMNAQTQWCEGCYRTLDEIGAWSTLSEEGKAQTWQRLLTRMVTHTGSI